VSTTVLSLSVVSLTCSDRTRIRRPPADTADADADRAGGGEGAPVGAEGDLAEGRAVWQALPYEEIRSWAAWVARYSSLSASM
jgi:hypothetical protein